MPFSQVQMWPVMIYYARWHLVSFCMTFCDLGATFEGYFHGFHGYFHGPGSPVYLVQKGQDGAHAVHAVRTQCARSAPTPPYKDCIETVAGGTQSRLVRWDCDPSSSTKTMPEWPPER